MSTITRILRTFSTSTPNPPAKSIYDDLYHERNLKRVVQKFKLFSQSQSFRNQSNVYTNTVHRLSSAKKHKWVEEILEHQKQYHDITKEGFAIRLITLYGKASMFDHAHQVFDEMPQRDCARTVKSFNAVLGACVSSKRFDKVDGLFSELKKELKEPDLVSYNTVIKAFCEMGSFESAIKVFGEIEEKGLKPDLISFNTLLIGLYGNGRFLEGEKIWDKMVNSGLKPDIRTYNAKMVGLVLEKRLNEAVEVFNELGLKNLEPDVFSYNAVINGLCNEGDLEEVKKWYGKVVSPNKTTFATVIRFACKREDLDWAVELFKESVERKCLVDPNVMQLVIDGLVKEAKIEEAKELVGIGNLNKFRRYNLTMPAEVQSDV